MQHECRIHFKLSLYVGPSELCAAPLIRFFLFSSLVVLICSWVLYLSISAFSGAQLLLNPKIVLGSHACCSI